MNRLFPTLACLALAATANAQVGQKANLDVAQWYNTPPISADQLQGHTVLVEVFRTW
jgi:hypothetical protein